MKDAQKTFELEVADFGPIVKAKIDLRPLTVFVGPSNTGKSYLAMLIYILHRYFNDKTGVIRQLMQIAENLISEQDSNEGRLQSAIPIIDTTSSSIDSEYFTSEIERCFGSNDISTLIRKQKKGRASIVWRFSGIAESETKMIENHLRIGLRKTEFVTNLHDEISSSIDLEKMSEEIERSRNFLRSISSGQIDERDLDFGRTGIIADILWSLLEYALVSSAYYLPAGRTGIMHAHGVIAAALIASASRPEDLIGSTPTLSGVSADFLGQLLQLDPRRKSTADFGKWIEKAVLQGSINVERSQIGYPRFTYRPEGWRESLTFLKTSSMISELAPIVLYLRHIVSPNDMLIIEEPESHLHPAMQIEFMRQIVPVVRAGIRIVIITHSEWILEELANIVQRSEVPASCSDENERAFSLPSKDVGAWLFEPRKRPAGSVISEIGLSESGLFAAGFDEVAMLLHNDWAEIRSKIGIKNDD